MKSARVPLAEIQSRVGAEVVPVMTPWGVVHTQSGTRWISWRNARQRGCDQGVDLQDRAILPGKVVAWSHVTCRVVLKNACMPLAEIQPAGRR